MLTTQQRQQAIETYKKGRLDPFYNHTDEGFANAVASIATEPGYQNSDSVLYDKALENPEAIGMTKAQVEKDRGYAVAKIAKKAYIQKAEETFEQVLSETDNPRLAQHTADAVLKYYNDETAIVADPIAQRDRARKVIADLQTYNQDGLSFGNFTGLADYMQTQASKDPDIALPYEGDMGRIAVSKTFVNQDADLGKTTRFMLSAMAATLPGNIGETLGMGDSAQRQYEAYKEQGFSNWYETVGAVGATLIQARLLGKAVSWKKFGASPGVANAISYIASSVGTGALQDYNESQHGLKNQYFNPIARTGDKTFGNQYAASRLFDLGTAVTGAYIGSRIESGLFGRGLEQLQATKQIGSLMMAQVLSPVLDTAADVALDVTAHNLLSNTFGEGEPMFTNSQELQLGLKGKDPGQILNQMATLFGIRMAAKAGSGVLNKALTDRSIDVTKSRDLMGTGDWWNQEIANRPGSEFRKSAEKVGMKLTNALFGNNLADLDEAFRGAYRDKAPNLTTFLRGNVTVDRNNLVAMYMQREAYKNWIVGMIAGRMDGRVRRELTSTGERAVSANVMLDTLDQLRKNLVVNVTQQDDAVALGRTVSTRLQAAATTDEVNAELDRLLETHRFDEQTLTALHTWLGRDVTTPEYKNVIDSYFKDVKARQEQRSALSARDKALYVRDLHIAANPHLTASARAHTVLTLNAGASARYDEFVQDNTNALRIVDERMRIVNDSEDGLLDILIRDSTPGNGTPNSLRELRTAAANFVAGRGGITVDNIHDELKTSLRAFAKERLTELKTEMQDVFAGKDSDEAAIRLLKRFQSEVNFIALAYPEADVGGMVKDLNQMYAKAPASIKKLYDEHIKSNTNLVAFMNKTGESIEGDMFTRFLATVGALADDIKYDRFLFNSKAAKSLAMTPREVFMLLNENYTIDNVRYNVAANRGFDIQETDDGVGLPTLRYINERGEDVLIDVAGVGAKKTIDAGLVFLMTARKGEFKSDPELVKTVAVLLRAAKFKADALRGRGTRAAYNVYADELDRLLVRLSTGPNNAITYNHVTGDIVVTRPSVLASSIDDHQEYISSVIRAISEDFEDVEAPDWRHNEKIAVFDGYLDGDNTNRTHTTGVRMETLANDLRIQAARSKIELNSVIMGISNSTSKGQAVALLDNYMQQHNLSSNMPPASRRQLAEYMIDMSRDMRGRSTTYDASDDQMIYSSEFSAGVESIDRQHGHVFVTISMDKVTKEQQDNLNNASYMEKELGLIKLQETGVNRNAIYMKIPNFDEKTKSSWGNSANLFWRSTIESISNRITSRDEASSPTGYSRAMDDVLQQAIARSVADPVETKSELIKRIASLYKDLANAGHDSVDSLIRRMTADINAASGTPYGTNTKVDTSTELEKLNAQSAIATALLPYDINAFRLGALISRSVDASANTLDWTAANRAVMALSAAMKANRSPIDITNARNTFLTIINPAGRLNPSDTSALNSVLDQLIDSRRAQLALSYSADAIQQYARLNHLIHRITPALTTHVDRLTNAVNEVMNAASGTHATAMGDLASAIAEVSASRQDVATIQSDYDDISKRLNALKDNTNLQALVLSTDVSNVEKINRGESVPEATGGVENRDVNAIRKGELEELEKIRTGFKGVLSTNKDTSPIFSVKNITDDKDGFIAFAAMGNLLMYGTKYIWAQVGIDKRGAGSREVRHRGFYEISQFIRDGLNRGVVNKNIVVMRVGLNSVNGVGVAPGLHLLTKTLYDEVNLNGGSKPVLTGDSALIKSQFTAADANDQMMRDLVKAYNDESRSSGRQVETSTIVYNNGNQTMGLGPRVIIPDIISFDSVTGKFFYDIDGTGRMNGNGQSNPEVHIMALDEDSFKQYSPNLIENTNFAPAGGANNGVSYYDMRREFRQADLTAAAQGPAIMRPNNQIVHTSVCAIRDKSIVADMFGSFMAHRDTTSTYAKDNTVSFQGANDDPNTRKYLADTLMKHTHATMEDLRRTMASLDTVTPQDIKDGMQKISNVVGDPLTSTGITTVIKNQRTTLNLIEVDGMNLRATLREGHAPESSTGQEAYWTGRPLIQRSTSSSNYPIQAHMGDGNIRELAIKHLHDLETPTTVDIKDASGNIVSVPKQQIIDAIKASQRNTTRDGFTIPDTAARTDAFRVLLQFIDAQPNSCIKSINIGNNQRAYFTMLNRSPNIQRGQGQSLPVLIAGIEADSDQISLHSSLARINLADFDGDTMSTQAFDVDSLRASLKVDNTVTEDTLIGHMASFAFDAIQRNKFTTMLTPVASAGDTDYLPRSERASGMVIGAFDKVNKVLTRASANTRIFEREDSRHTEDFSRLGMDSAILYSETDSNRFTANNARGAADRYVPLESVTLGGDKYTAIYVRNVDASGNKTHHIYICDNEPEISGIGYKVKYVYDLNETGDDIPPALVFNRLNTAVSDLNATPRITNTNIHDVSAEKLRFTSFALLHKILQSTSIDAPKYGTLYRIFNAKGADFPDYIESLAELMTISLSTRTIWVNGKALPATYRVSNKDIHPSIITTTEEYQKLLDAQQGKITNIGSFSQAEIAASMNKLKTAGPISNEEYDTLVKFGSKKVVSDVSDMADILDIFNNVRLKDLAEKFAAGGSPDEFENMHPDFLKGLGIAWAFKTLTDKFMLTDNMKKLGIKEEDFVQTKDSAKIPIKFKDKDGKTDGQPMKITYAIELRQILDEVNSAFSNVIMTSHTKSTMAHLKNVLGTEVTISLPGTRGTSENAFRKRLYDRIVRRNPGNALTMTEMEALLTEMDISIHEQRVIHEGMFERIGEVKAEMLAGRTSVEDLSEQNQKRLHGLYGDAETFSDGVALKHRNGSPVTVGTLIRALDSQIATYEGRSKSSKTEIRAGAKMKLEQYKALALELGGELQASQQHAFKAVANGLTDEVISSLLEYDGIISGGAVELFKQKRMAGATKHLFKEIFNTRQELGIC